MSRVLAIGDVHLKTKIFDRADEILASGQADFAVQMGDLVDDWGEEFNLALYGRTLQRAIKFHKDHPGTLWVMGNHDYGYHHTEWGPRETGHSKFVEGEVRTWLQEMERIGAEQKIMHIVDGVIFTHAGLTCEWVERQKNLVGLYNHEVLDSEQLLRLVNFASSEELWSENSPIWARPQEDGYAMWPCKLQVVGHTPVRTVAEDNDVLSTDTFSTYRNGAPFGDGSFAIIDTKGGKWEKIET